MEHARAVSSAAASAAPRSPTTSRERGWRDVILLDRAELTSGSTFHSAGLVGQLRSSVTLTRMMVDGVALYRRLAGRPASIRAGARSGHSVSPRRTSGWRSSAGRPGGRARSA